MKGLAKCILAVFLVSAFLFLTLRFIFPFVYKIKEPYFEMPLKYEEDIKTIEDLPIRDDPYGNGEFGAKRKGGRKHKGLDLQAELNCPVYASKSGWARSGYYPKGYGKLVVINHPGGWQTRYGHLSRSDIKRAQWVRQGDIIGSVGKTGNARSRGIMPHLHFEIRHKGEPLDPAGLLIRIDK